MNMFIIGFICRFNISIAMNAVMQYIMEVLPTVARAQGSAAIRSIGYIITFLAPYVVYTVRMNLKLMFDTIVLIT